MKVFGKNRRLATWKELKQAANESGIVNKAEDFLCGMIAMILLCMTALLFYMMALVMCL